MFASLPVLSSRNLHLAVLAIALFVYLPTLSVQDTFSSANVGDNLYASEAVSKGQLPYRDFNWNYGPIMLYYNAFFFNLFGHDLHSLILGRIVLKTVFAGVYFLAALKIMPPLGAFLMAMAYIVLAPDFVHNFSHYGGIGLEIAVLWAVLSYSQSPRRKYIYWTAFYVLLLGFNKINFGIAIGGASLGALVACDLFNKIFRKDQLFLYGKVLFSIIFIWLFVLFFFVKGLTYQEINQCFPILPGYVYFGRPVPEGFVALINDTVKLVHNSPFDCFIFLCGLAAALRIIFIMASHYNYQKRMTSFGRNFLLTGFILLLFILASYNEYYKGGLDYMAYWAKPFTMMMIGYLISEACVVSGLFIQSIVAVMFVAVFVFHGYQNWKHLESFKNPAHFFSHKGINIYVTCDPRDTQRMLWTADYIEKNIPAPAPFFTFPDDGLYYFLAGRLAPYRLVYLYGSEKIIPQQEIKLIKALEKKDVEYFILDDVGFFGNMWGRFGQDNCPLLYQYIMKEYRETANFQISPNRWEGMRIYKRIKRPQ